MKKKSFRYGCAVCMLSMSFYSNAQTLQQAIQVSHGGDYNRAAAMFTQLLAKDANNVNTLVAAGYNSAWSKNYALAKKRFLHAKSLAPHNTDATKGLGYTYLYKGDYGKAINIFSSLATSFLAEEEYQMSLALAYLNRMQPQKATQAFKKVLNINPTNGEAVDYIQAIQKQKSIVELSVIAGTSNIETVHKIGLRQLQATYRFNSNHTVYARYDNSLGLDNFFLLKNNFNTKAITGGLYSRWHNRIASKVEISRRALPNDIKQHMLLTEQVLFLPKNFQLKLGGFLVNTEQSPTEWTAMGGLSIPAGRKLKVEPYYYFTNRVIKENRYVLNLLYKISNEFDIAAGIMRGNEQATKSRSDNDIFGLYCYSNFKLVGPLNGSIVFRNEKERLGNNLFTAAAGLKFLIPTNNR